MLSRLRQYFRSWAYRRSPEQGIVRLTQKRIYILPTRRGFGFAFVLLLMLLGDINYNLSLGYVLTFLLATAAAMTMLHAFRNMAQVEIRAGRAEPVFAGEEAGFTFHFHNKTDLPRYQLILQDSAGHRSGFDLPAQQDTPVQLRVPAPRRGWLACGQLSLYTEFPLGLFHAWSYASFDSRCLVYPKPATRVPLPVPAAEQGTGALTRKGDEDFAGLRAYTAGDALPRIAWKALAREQGLQVKHFSAPQGQELWLDWSQLPAIDSERKLEQLSGWVVQADAAQLQYGLRLPAAELPPGSGPAQREACLRLLALYGRDSTPQPAPAPARKNNSPAALLARLRRKPAPGGGGPA